MGQFDDASGNFVPGGNLAKPLLIALGALLVGKWLGGKNEPAAAQPQQQSEEAGRPDGGLIGGLGGLIDRLRNNGLGDAADSWVGPGQNAPIQPGQLGSALGQKTIGELARQAGMSEQELLQQLSQVLPGLVDKLTPEGRLPDSRQVAALLQR